MSFRQHCCRQYYKLLNNVFKMERRTKLIPIDFHRPWWMLLKAQRGALIIVFCFEVLNNIFFVLPALMLERCFSHGSWYFGCFVGLWFVVLALELISDFYYSRTITQTTQSIHYSANHHLLQVDPIFHQSSTKGKILAKIYRSSESYQEIIRAAFSDIMQVVVGGLTVIISFLTIDLKLGLITLVLLTLLSCLSIALFIFTAHVLVPPCIDADDKVKNFSTESLMQINLIRSTFSSSQMDEKLRGVNKKRLTLEANAKRAYDIISSLTKVAYVCVFMLIGFYLFGLINSGVIGASTGVVLLVTFFTGTYTLLQIGQCLYRFKEQLERVRDIFAFMRDYGQQTFPVMEPINAKNITPKIESSNDIITIQARDIKFRYTNNKLIFNHHDLSLSVPTKQPHKLYGIIGYSGQGKSTLLSILGGQLKPHAGAVIINGMSLYDINEDLRRQLLTLQHQASSGFYGTIRYNLTFGLPKGHLCRDEELIHTLTLVGLWDTLEQKRGLDTKVSEGGLTLSSGQRQRLDFAGLYLRAQYYKPAFILLDEPTSHLDEENEKNIIALIEQLAQKSVVLVVSHRLKTLEKTEGILDLSLSGESKQLTFLTHDMLVQKSFYYRQLLANNAPFALSKKPYIPDLEQPVHFDITQAL